MKRFTIFLEKLVEKINKETSRSHKRIMESTVLFDASTYAQKNLPHPDDPTIDNYLVGVRGAYTALKKDVSMQLQGDIQGDLGKVNIATANKQIELEAAAINQIDVKIEHLETDQRRIVVPHNFETIQKVRLILFFIAIGEVIWTTSSFLFLRDMLISALILGVVIGIAQVTIAKTTTLIIKETTNPQRRSRLMVLGIGAAFILSFVISLLRYWFIHRTAGVNIPLFIMSPVTFTIINLLFITTTVVLVYYYIPSKDSLRRIDKFNDLTKKISKLRRIKNKLQERLSELINQRESITGVRMEIIHAEKTLHEKIDAHYDEAVGTFKTENIAKRADNVFPISFRNSYQPLPKISIRNII